MAALIPSGCSRGNPLIFKASQFADGLARAAEHKKWTRPPETRDFGRIAEVAAAGHFYSRQDLLDAGAEKRQELYDFLRATRPGWVRKMRRGGASATKPPAFQEAGISTTLDRGQLR